MKILIILFFVVKSNLAVSDDNVAMESEVNYQHNEPEFRNERKINLENSQNLGKDVVGGLKESADGRQNQFRINVQKLSYEGDEQSNHVDEHISQDLGHNDAAVHSLQSNSYHFTHPQQFVYMQSHNPKQIRIIGAQAAQLQQINDGHQKTLGYSSYVEHVSDKEEEEIKSALKEGSVKDIKRLVPKSGISFKIYKKEKIVGPHSDSQNSDTQTNYLIYNNQAKEEIDSQNIKHGHKIQTKLQETQHFQKLDGTQDLYLKGGVAGGPQQYQYHQENVHQSGQVLGTQLQQAHGIINVNYKQSIGSSPRPAITEVSDKSSSGRDTHFNLQVNGGNLGRATSTIEFNKNANSIAGSKTIKSKEKSQKYNHIQSSTGGLIKPEIHLKNQLNHLHAAVRPTQSYQYQATPLFQPETGKVTQNSLSGFGGGGGGGGGGGENLKSGLTSYISHPETNIETNQGGVFISHTTVSPILDVEPLKTAHVNFIGQTVPHTSVDVTQNGQTLLDHSKSSYQNAEVGHGDQIGFVSHHPVDSYADSETAKTSHHDVIGHISPTSYVDIQTGKTEQSSLGHVDASLYTSGDSLKNAHVTTHSYVDEESEKTNQDNLISHVPANTYIETEGLKNGQSNFDHQKALEGSTSFDFKNAIGNTEALSHQNTVHYTSPTQETKYIGNGGKQLLGYIQIPAASTAGIENHPHVSSLLEGHRSKDFDHGVVTHEFSYPKVSLPVLTEVNGKYVSSPQAFSIWTSDHLKQGNKITANDFHQPLIKLHLPKEELHHLKTSHIEFPAIVWNHNHIAQKHPISFHNDIRYLKFPKEIYFQSVKNQIPNLRGLHQIKLQPSSYSEWNFQKPIMQTINHNNLIAKPEIISYLKEPGKKVIPIVIKKVKTRSNKDIGVIYGKVNGNRGGPVRPNHRQEKNFRMNLSPEASNNVNIFKLKNDRNNEFSVSASYKVDRSLKSSDGS